MLTTTQPSRFGMIFAMCTGQRPGTGALLCVILLFPECVFLTSCNGDRGLINEQNPYFIQGVEFRDNEQFEKAAEAFQACLRHSPRSSRAHLHLAMIYEDHLQDFPQAIVHYRAYLRLQPEALNAGIVKEWLRRAEKQYYEQLHAMYEAAGPDSVSAGEADNDPDIGASDLSRPADPVATADAGVEHLDAEAYDSDYRELSTSKAAAEKAAPPFYVVAQGDTLSRIAERLYGDSRYWEHIYEANRQEIIAPGRLRIGLRLRLPGLE